VELADTVKYRAGVQFLNAQPTLLGIQFGHAAR
jgi:hypothetical protein